MYILKYSIAILAPALQTKCAGLSCEHSCEGITVNNIDSAQCFCPIGYELKSDLKTCKDVNECTQTSPPHPCNSGCQNNDGGFTCTCPDGEILDTNDLVSCNGRWKHI